MSTTAWSAPPRHRVEALLGPNIFYEVFREAGGTGEVPRKIKRLAQGRVVTTGPPPSPQCSRTAGDKGWLTDNGASIQAHCEWQ